MNVQKELKKAVVNQRPVKHIQSKLKNVGFVFLGSTQLNRNRDSFLPSRPFSFLRVENKIYQTN